MAADAHAMQRSVRNRYNVFHTGVSAGSLVLLLMLGGCGPHSPAPPTASAPGASVVEMEYFSYNPAEITVRTGDTVEWRNTSSVAHTVTFDPVRAKDPSHVALPPGVEPFDSGRIPPNATFHHSFTVPGTYRYVCLPHEEEGMLGTVIVTAVPVS